MRTSRPWTRRIVAAANVWGLFACYATTASLAGLGRLTDQTATPQETAVTVWSGVYSAAQAKRGEAAANKNCTKCHNADLTGGQDGPSLVGQEVLDAWSNLTLGDLFERIKTTMPADMPQTLSPQETADILAYALSLSKCPAGEMELPADAAALSQIRVTGRQGAE